MAVRKLSGGYYTRKGDYIWVWVEVQPGEETPYSHLHEDFPSGWVGYVGAHIPTTAANLKSKNWYGTPWWKKMKGGTASMSGANLRRGKWRKVKADKVPYVWRKFLNRFK